MQTQLEIQEFKVDPETFLGLTEWRRTTVNPPPFTGWWKTRRSDSPAYAQPQRRWWDGEFWSLPAFPNDSDAEVVVTKQTRAHTTTVGGEIEWCGLKHPHPDTPREDLIKMVPELAAWGRVEAMAMLFNQRNSCA